MEHHILAEYLNRCSFGNRRLGPEAAARAYFGKPARNLTLPEAVFLAGLPQAPTRLNPWRYPDLTQRKFARSVDRSYVYGGVEAVGRPLDEHVRFLIEALRPIADEIGL